MRLERDRYAAKVCFLLVGWPFDVCICTYMHICMYIYIYLYICEQSYARAFNHQFLSYNLFDFFGASTFTHADTHIPEEFCWLPLGFRDVAGRRNPCRSSFHRFTCKFPLRDLHCVLDIQTQGRLMVVSTLFHLNHGPSFLMVTSPKFKPVPLPMSNARLKPRKRTRTARNGAVFSDPCRSDIWW